MKIQNSTVAMASAHSEYSYSYAETATIEAISNKSDAYAAILNISKEGGLSYKESIEAYRDDNERAKKQQQDENLANMMRFQREQEEEICRANGGRSQWDFSDEYDMKIKMLRKMLELLRNGRLDKDTAKMAQDDAVLDLRSAANRQAGGFDFRMASSKTSLVIGTSTSAKIASTPTSGGGTVIRNATTWQRITATSGTISEYENTTFASKGQALTADGRSLDFNVEVTLGRSLTKHFDKIDAVSYVVMDPLVINLDSAVTSVSDQKFMFDLDSDGKEESISFAGKGSGFLAYDANGDGVINDGSELFGTKSGDGFADLSKYDTDGNGWIDEGDEIFSKLKVWTRDADGVDHLLDLKEADVGAIYLGSADTQFTQKNDDGDALGFIRRTGIYLKESTGVASTIAHVDLVV